MGLSISLHPVDYAIMAIYVLFVVGIGFALKRYMKSSSDFLTSGRSIPAWITGLAFISANLGALELVGMAASGAKYGIATCHFYWVGAIPAIVFLAVFMMPFYYGSKARSVPEYLNMRFDGRVRCLNSIAFAVMTVFASGISMNALAKLLNQILGWNYHLSLWICSGVVLLYVLKGGLTSAIYTEVLQFFMIVLGFAPVVYLGLKDVGGWSVLKGKLADVATNPATISVGDKAFDSNAWSSAWQPMLSGPGHNPMGIDWFAMVFGLGFVLSFGYWCTNFLVVQRAMAAKDMSAARRTPLIGAVPKMFLPLLVILPGMIAAGLALTAKDGYDLPKKSIEPAAFVKIVPLVKAAPAVAGLDAQAAAKVTEDLVAKVKAEADVKLVPFKVAALVKDMPALASDETALKKRIQGAAENDYDLVIISLVSKYCPLGLLGLALTALLASFMSGMAGNVTAFNTIWTYDLYQAYIAPKKTDDHYMWMGRATTVAGILVSIGCAYFAKQFNNAMDVIQLVFGFVNAPLFATFLLGMFWKRITATAAFYGLFLGILTSVVFHGLTIAKGETAGFVKGAWLAKDHAHVFQSGMAQNFWLASFAFIGCFVFTVLITFATKQTKTDEELKGLVYSLTPKVVVAEKEWYLRPGILGTVLLAVCIILNWLFW